MWPGTLSRTPEGFGRNRRHTSNFQGRRSRGDVRSTSSATPALHEHLEMATTTTTTTTTTAPKTPYSWTEPADEKLRWSDHFSSLLFGGSWQDTLLELVLLCIPLALWATLGSTADVPGSMGMLELAAYFWSNAVYVACLHRAPRRRV